MSYGYKIVNVYSTCLLPFVMWLPSPWLFVWWYLGTFLEIFIYSFIIGVVWGVHGLYKCGLMNHFGFVINPLMLIVSIVVLAR